MVDKLTKNANGFGRAIRHDGWSIFEGQFKDGSAYGYGRLIQQDGNVVEGYWSYIFDEGQ